MTFFLIISAIMIFSTMATQQSSQFTKIAFEEVAIGAMSVYAGLILFLLVIMGLQVTTSFVSTRTSELLHALPLTKRDISLISLITYLRIFDIPLVVGIVVPPFIYYFFTGSIFGSLICFLVTVTAEAFALELSIGLAKFFYAKVLGGGGKSVSKLILRFIYILVWLLPTFGIYLIMRFAADVSRIFTSVSIFSPFTPFLAFIYPFCFGLVISYLMAPNLSALTISVSIFACIFYIALSAYGLKWLISVIRRLSISPVHVVREKVKDLSIKPRNPWLGIIVKDLRIASRSPSYASFLLMPAIQTAIIAISFLSVGALEPNIIMIFTMLSLSAFVILLLPPTLFSIEALASTYTMTLPIKKTTVITAKTILLTIIYALSFLVLLSIAFYTGKTPELFLAVGIPQTFAVAAATILELLILIWKFGKEGFSIGNLYSRLSVMVIVVLPGIIIAMAPMVISIIAHVVAESLALPVFTLACLLEFVVMALATKEFVH